MSSTTMTLSKYIAKNLHLNWGDLVFIAQIIISYYKVQIGEIFNHIFCLHQSHSCCGGENKIEENNYIEELVRVAAVKWMDFDLKMPKPEEIEEYLKPSLNDFYGEIYFENDDDDKEYKKKWTRINEMAREGAKGILKEIDLDVINNTTEVIRLNLKNISETALKLAEDLSQKYRNRPGGNWGDFAFIATVAQIDEDWGQRIPRRALSRTRRQAIREAPYWFMDVMDRGGISIKNLFKMLNSPLILIYEKAKEKYLENLEPILIEKMKQKVVKALRKYMIKNPPEITEFDFADEPEEIERKRRIEMGLGDYDKDADPDELDKFGEGDYDPDADPEANN